MAANNVAEITVKNVKGFGAKCTSNALFEQKAIISWADGKDHTVTFTGNGEGKQMLVDKVHKSFYTAYGGEAREFNIKVEFFNKPEGASDFRPSKLARGSGEGSDKKSVYRFMSEDSTDNDDNDAVLEITVDHK